MHMHPKGVDMWTSEGRPSTSNLPQLEDIWLWVAVHRLIVNPPSRRFSRPAQHLARAPFQVHPSTAQLLAMSQRSIYQRFMRYLWPWGKSAEASGPSVAVVQLNGVLRRPTSQSQRIPGGTIHFERAKRAIDGSA
jgi:hypothetical protein